MVRAFIIYLRTKASLLLSSFFLSYSTFFLFIFFYLLSFYLIYLSFSSCKTLSFFYSLANDHLVDVSLFFLPFSLIRTKLLLMKDFEKNFGRVNQLSSFIRQVYKKTKKMKKKNFLRKILEENFDVDQFTLMMDDDVLLGANLVFCSIKISDKNFLLQVNLN